MQIKREVSRRFPVRLQLTWLGCKALGPLTFLDFSNCGLTLVIWPKALINDNLCTTCKKHPLEEILEERTEILEKETIHNLCHSRLVHPEPFNVKITRR